MTTRGPDAWLDRLRRDPGDPEAFVGLRDLYRSAQDWKALSRLLSGWAGHARDRHAAASALQEAAEITIHQLGDPKRAAEYLERALVLDPLRAESSELLLSVFDTLDDDHRFAEHLERRGRALNNIEADAEMLAAAHHEIAELWRNRLRRNDRALLHYQKAFELSPSEIFSIRAAREIFLAEGHREPAARLYELEAEVETDERRRAHLLQSSADLRKSEAHAEQVHATDPTAEHAVDADALGAGIRGLEDARLGALETLVRDALVPRLVTELSATPHDPSLRQLYDEALAAIDRVSLLSYPPPEEQASAPPPEEAPTRLADQDLRLREQVALLERAEDWPRLADALESLAERSQEEERAAILEQLATIAAEQLNDRGRALDALRRWSNLDERDPRPLGKLAELLEQGEFWDDLADALDALGQLQDNPAAQRSYATRAATVALERLGDAEGVWSRLAAHAVGLTDEGFSVLRTAARSLGRSAILASLLVDRTAQDTPTEDLQSCALRASTLLVEDAGDVNGAFAALTHASTQLGFDAEILDRMAELSQRMGAVDRLAEHLEYLLDETLDPERAAALLLRRGQALEALEDFTEAAAAYREILVIRPGDSVATDRLNGCLARAPEESLAVSRADVGADPETAPVVQGERTVMRSPDAAEFMALLERSAQRHEPFERPSPDDHPLFGPQSDAQKSSFAWDPSASKATDAADEIEELSDIDVELQEEPEARPPRGR